MPISLILTPFDHFQIRLTFAVTPNLILEPCHMKMKRPDVKDQQPLRSKAGHDPLVPAFIKPLDCLVLMVVVIICYEDFKSVDEIPAMVIFG